ncbi:hypothetical protein [Thalassotalea sp. Y01]|uniref:hypothetical protein n=1 Tax=Thalassotalea sp. Y01 TaxID=2729613 RepID=UPI00145F4629|nr:hypothetical protein [Thalassotalea sp. Y01]NMP15256.1 hypothetical protein [Thalassotalea sp. Y01]
MALVPSVSAEQQPDKSEQSQPAAEQTTEQESQQKSKQPAPSDKAKTAETDQDGNDKTQQANDEDKGANDKAVDADDSDSKRSDSKQKNSEADESEQDSSTLKTLDTDIDDNDIVDTGDANYLEDDLLQQFETEFDELKGKIIDLSRSVDDYEELYARMRPVIEEKTQRLYERVSAKHVDLRLMTQLENDSEYQELFARVREIRNFYLLRQQIFNEASDEFKSLLTSTKLNGVTEAKLELSYLRLQLVIIIRGTFQRVFEVPARFAAAPLDIFMNLVMLIVGIILFRTWRNWAKEGLSQWRQKILAVRPRTSGKIKAARAVWYFEHTRSPLEWLIFINYMLRSADILQIPMVIEVLTTITFWVCVTFFAFSFLSKVIERGKQNLLRNITRAQSLSLKIAVWWVGWYKLSIELAEIFIAHGTILSWLFTAFLWLLLPVYIFFIQQWRDDCFTYMDQERDTPEFISKLLKSRTRLKGFAMANLALAMVLYYVITKGFLGLISKVESGRRITAEIYRKKLLSDNSELLEKSKSLANLSPEQSDILIESEETYVASVLEEPIDKVMTMLEQNERSHIAVTGERGMGKTFFLHSLQKKHPNALILRCSEDFGEIIEQVREQLEIESENVKAGDIIKALEENQIDLVLMDNCHRLLTPEASGQREIRRLYGWINELKGMCLWVLTFDNSSWPLLSALGIATGFYSATIELQPWSEEQIIELFDRRCKEANIEVDYSQLIIPRQLVDVEDETIEGRNKSGIYRIIWGYAEGNPAIACRTLAASINVEYGGYLAQLPAYPDNKIIESFDINTLLVLRTICQFGRCNTNDIVNNLRLHGLIVNSALSASVAQDILEQVSGRYQITWLWFRPVSKYLARQNLLPR